MTVDLRYATDPETVETATTTELRSRYLIEDLFASGEVRAVYTHEDRMVVAGAVPGDGALALPSFDVTGTLSHLERRELGVVNVGEPGEVIVDGAPHKLNALDGLYVGRGSNVAFTGEGACFYLVSALADVTYPVARFSRDTVEPVHVGDPATASSRLLYRYVWGGGHPSCQLQFGVTVVSDGSVWNTMPAHLHRRRTEVYLYTGLPADARVLHILGQPGATRHLFVANRQAVIAPSWSVHAGAGTAPYAFVWAMAGENTDYGDLAPVAVAAL
ncbi:5-dehydro-4-deoxy-D-glucuronate isomerase [Dactylosporangium sp. NPDC048998]|uniref:5-dehydro-4-deoxy-D-glucuronate isomerase n=1 Tax=Dactylosporangium sp. NPDC048998 TaxID=3363976 RepID=UPI003711F25C